MSKQNDYVCARGHRFVQRVQQLRTAKNAVGCGICSNKYLLRGFNSLADTDPHLVPLWHVSKNGDLRPEDVVAGSEAIVFWTCPEEGGHDYDMMVAKKKKGVGCPYCTNKRVDPSINSLSFTNASAAAGWHPHRNGDLTPDDVVAGCNRKVWWRCAEEGHDFEMKVAYRSRGDRCYYCAGKKVHPTTSFAVTQPRAASRWHPSRNGSRTPADVLPGSAKKVWWLCEEKNHHYFASVLTQTRGAGCNICTGRAVDEQNCMRTTRPDLVRDFHPTANGAITPDNVMATTGKRITWLCRNGHHWVASGTNRANQGTGCPYCSNFSCWTGWNDVATVRPDLAADWDWSNNPGLTPRDVVPGTNKRIAWKCTECEHRWNTKGADRAAGAGCPECYRTKPRRRR